MVGDHGRQQVGVWHRDQGEFHKLLYWKIPSWIDTYAGTGVAGGAILCGIRVLSGFPLLDGRQIGRVSDADRKTWLVWSILVSVVRGLGLGQVGAEVIVWVSPSFFFVPLARNLLLLVLAGST